MKVKTHVKAGGLDRNHNQALVRDHRKAKGLKVQTSVRAGGLGRNHNEAMVCDGKPRS